MSEDRNIAIYKIALGSNGPLAGKSTLARWLRDRYGFFLADQGRTLVQAFVERFDYAHGMSVEKVYANKERYRQDLQRFGWEAGFNDPGPEGRWLEKTLEPWHEAPAGTSVVVDSVRVRQGDYLRDQGFLVAKLMLPWNYRRDRAIELGLDPELLAENMRAAPEIEDYQGEVDIELPAQLGTELIGQILLERAKVLIDSSKGVKHGHRVSAQVN